MRKAIICIAVLAAFGVAYSAMKCRYAYDESAFMLREVGRTSDVLVRVVHLLKNSDRPGFYTGKQIITFDNQSSRAIKAKLPVIRRLSISPISVGYEATPKSGPFTETRILTLAANSLTEIETGFEMFIDGNPTPMELYRGQSRPQRYGWVFDIPDGEPPGDWLSGTIISEPVEWRPFDGQNY